VGDQPHLDAAGGELFQRRRHVVIEAEMLTRRPLRVDFARAGIKLHSGSTHPLDDAPGIPDEDGGVVDMVLLVVENQRRPENRLRETNRIDLDAVPGAETLVALALKRRAWID